MEIFKVEKDENKDPNITDGKAAFDLLSGLVSNHKKRLREPDEETSTNHLPGCLSDLLSCEKSVRKFSCMLCGRLFHDSHQLVVHSHSHTAKDNSQNECCFCGRGFEDYLKLTLHQIAMPVRHKCQNCFQGFENYNKYTHHSCRKRSKSSTIDTNLTCKLGCSKERKFESEEELELHLYSLHGASMDDLAENNDAMKFCLLCKSFINAYRLSLEDHTFFRCTARHPWVVESIYGLYQIAKEQSLNLTMLIKLHLQCQLEEWKAREYLRGQDTSKGSLIKVPPHVSKDVLTKCLKIADLKYNQQEPEFVLPPAFNAQTFTNINPSKDVIKIFHYWNSIVSLNFAARKNTIEESRSFGFLCADIYKNINKTLPQLNDEKKRFIIPKTKPGQLYKEFLNDEAPPYEVLKRLSKDLGAMVSTRSIFDPLGRDFLSLKSNGLYVRDYDTDPKPDQDEKQDSSSQADDGEFDPSQFLQVIHKK